MMNWTRTNGDGNGGITINTPNAGRTWAPEAYWDDDLNAYVVLLLPACSLMTPVLLRSRTTKPAIAPMLRVRYAITRDFVNFN